MSTALFALNSSSFAIELRQHRLYRVESTMADSVPLLLELEEGFTFRGRPVHLKLSQKKLTWGPTPNGRGPTHVLRTADMLGSKVHTRRRGRDGRPTYSLEVYNYVPTQPPSCCNRGGGEDEPIRRKARHVMFEAGESLALAEQLDNAIKDLLNPLPPPPDDEEAGEGGAEGEGDAGETRPPSPVARRRRRLLIFINPVSGVRRAKQTFLATVKPMLEQADVEHEVIVTERRNHARDHVKAMKGDVAGQWDGMVVIGGDGLLYEVINGLWERDPEGMSALRSMPVGIIRGGTGNGLFATVLHHNRHRFDELSATFVILKGRTMMPADISFVQQASGARHLSFLSLTWGLIADVDLESESLRCLGMARTTVYALLCIARLRGYRGRFSYLPAEEPDRDAAAKSPIGAASVATRTQRNTTQVSLPPLDQPLPEGEGWVTIEADFLLLLVSHVSHIAEDVHISPGKVLGDGVFHVLVLRKPISRAAMLDLFLQIETGQHVHGKQVEVYWAKAYRLEPLTSQGLYSLDGEPIDYGPIQAAVVPQAVQLMSDASHLFA